MANISLTTHLSIDESELTFDYVRAPGPGGQNVNKVATAVQMRFDVRHTPSLPEDVCRRLEKLAGRRLTDEGVLLIEANRYRTQEQNRQDAIARLAALVQQAEYPPKPRHATRPTRASQERRLAGKQQRGLVKKLRQQRSHPED